jgi:MSHA pilin protein MshC
VVTFVRERGFTLVELVTCIIIMGVLAAVAAPKFFDNQPFTERGYADELAAALRVAQKVAVASDCEVAVTIDPLAGYQAMQRAPAGNTCSGGGAWSTPVMLPSGRALAGAPPSGATVNTAVQIVFNAQGGLNAPAPPVLQIGLRTLAVDATSGFVVVQ